MLEPSQRENCGMGALTRNEGVYKSGVPQRALYRSL